MDYAESRSYGCRVKSYQHMESSFIDIQNDKLLVTIWPDKGADITSILLKSKDVDLMWKAPVGIRSPIRHISTCGTVLGNNLDYYEGGWHSAIPGGGPYQDMGMEQGIHGEAALLPWQWQVETDTEACVSVKLWCSTVRAPLDIERRITLKKGSGKIQIEAAVKNRGGIPFPLMWGEHPTFGRPFLAAGDQISIDTDQMWVSDLFDTKYGHFEPGSRQDWPLAKNKYGKKINLALIPEDSVKEAEVYVLSGTGGYEISNSVLEISVKVDWDSRVFPYIWYWKVLRGIDEYPWFGNTYCIGLEFWNGYPNYIKAKENHQLPVLEPGEELRTEFSMEVKTQ